MIRAALLEALRQTGGNKSDAARLLSVTQLTIQNRMHNLGLDMRKVVTSE